MILENIDLINFRLHKNTSLNFSNHLNYLLGGNGQGKTTILEAIYYLCTTKNLNGFSDNDAVNFSEKFFEINGKFIDLSKNELKIHFNAELNKKSLFADGKQFYRASSIIGKFPVVTLTQAGHAITMGAPANRRKFVDSVISQASETYLKLLMEYNKTLRQRSSLLTQIKETNNHSLFGQLDAWTDALKNTGSLIVKHRMSFVNEFNNYVMKTYENIMNDSEKPAIDYKFLDCPGPENVEENFYRTLTELREHELRRAKNLVGPHRDDFIFKINDRELKKYGSQGQHKTFQISLRFGEFFYLKDYLNKTPIFLMDDVFGELDAYRAESISNYLKDVGQAFITMTDLSNFKFLNKADDDLVVNVDSGAAVYE